MSKYESLLYQMPGLEKQFFALGSKQERHFLKTKANVLHNAL